MKIDIIEDVYSGTWLVMKKAIYRTKSGKAGYWEFVERTSRSGIVTMICQSVTTGKILLTSQPRIPIDAVEISFPSGLIDDSETMLEAALRELKEETGYTGEIISFSRPLPKSAGLTNEATSLVLLDIEEEKMDLPSMEDTEDITSFWVHPSEFFDYVESLDEQKVMIAHDVYSFMLGCQNNHNGRKKKFLSRIRGRRRVGRFFKSKPVKSTA
ncbi:MAG: NUDIX domain-containing protein [Candidatus Heimdallarchaeota archaeon]